MNIGIIVNPKSGRNKASQFAESCVNLLKRRYHTTSVLHTHELQQNDQVWSCDRLIIIGGDGTVHHTLPKLIKYQIPFYHLATGTANLIATEFNMPKKPATAVRWVERGGQAIIDVPTIDSVPFLVMCSLGMDAGVIHRFEQLRTHSGGFRNYIRPVIHEMLSPRPAHITIAADGTDLHVRQPMNLVIANMRSYALAINPCPEADPTDSQLNLLAAPCSTTLNWSIQTMLNRFRFQIPNSTRLQASNILITATDTPARIQIDGEIASTSNMPDGILDLQQSIKLQVGQYQIKYITAPD